MTDLERAFKTLSAKAGQYKTLFQYADGNQPLVYSTNRLKEAFSNISAKFSQNWCSVVVDAALDRLTFKGWALKDKAATQTLADIFSKHDISQDAYDIHRSASITSESYAIAWKGEDGEIEFNFNDPRLCHVFYKPDNPKKVDFAAKWYLDGDVYKLILYYRDRLEYYTTDKVSSTPTSVKKFKPDDPDRADNPYGEIPVFHFYLSKNSRGDLYNITTLQDSVNKLFADMMVAAEFGAFPQRYVISESTDGTLKNAANEVWRIPSSSDGNTSVGQFAATNLDNYLNAMDKIANSIAIISRTPKHYFYSAGSGISGEALLAMEAPLTKKVEQRMASFSSTWKQVGAFLLKLETGAVINPGDIQPVWEPAQSIQPKTEADTAKVWVEAGAALRTALSWAGKTDEEIKEAEKDLEEAKKQGATVAKQLLDAARTKQDQSNEINPNKENVQ